MFERHFSHYLSYGATDQETARELRGEYDGLLVPGTVAAFQADGTRGFVLTLSASSDTRYVIDPRFPLFQQRLIAPKRSHISLAEVLGDPGLVSVERDPQPEWFTRDRIESIAEAWIAFNRGYSKVKEEHFKKYAQRLGEEVVLKELIRRPDQVLPPYLMAGGIADAWWHVSVDLWEATKRAATDEHLVRVVAARSSRDLRELGLACDEGELTIWASGLDELDVSIEGQHALIAYRQSIRDLSATGHQTFALYGGFFSVLMSAFGLRGSSHGIGYGEARVWLELPTSGPPPARYYLAEAHRYVSQDLAAILWQQARDLIECDCVECEGRNPALLEYQSLMKHSVHCRHKEIEDWGTLPASQQAARLRDAARTFREAIVNLDVPRALQRQADNSYAHLSAWGQIVAGFDA